MAKPPKMQGYVVTIGWFSVKVNRDRARAGEQDARAGQGGPGERAGAL